MVYSIKNVQRVCDLAQDIFQNENKAREYLEAQRWPDGPYCPHCGSVGNLHRLEGVSHRPGLYQCNACRQHFTVTVGTVFERSHVPLCKWLLACHLMSSSKKGISAHQLHRILRVTYKTAWFMAHRLREAMRGTGTDQMGGPGTPVQADETYYGTKDDVRGETWSKKKGHRNKMVVIALVSGKKARTFHAANAKAETVRGIVEKHASKEAELHTDESPIYTGVGHEYAAHKTVNHSLEEWVGKDGQTVNACENYFSVFKRGMFGVFQHCSEKHLQRYLCEFDFRYNHRAALGFSDWERCAIALKGIAGKRLTYRRSNQGHPAQERPA